MSILKPEDISAYLTAADKHDALPMFYLELVSGLRKGKLVALRWDDKDVGLPHIRFHDLHHTFATLTL